MASRHGFHTGPVQTVSPIAPPRIQTFDSPWQIPRPPWQLPRVFGIGKNGHTRQKVGNACAWLPSRAILASLFLATRTDHPLRAARAQVLHFGNCKTCVVGNHYNARAFKDLAEFVDHFLFLGSIHSFTPNLGVSPRLIFSPQDDGIRVQYQGPEAEITRRYYPSEILSRSPSQEGITGLSAQPSVSDRT